MRWLGRVTQEKGGVDPVETNAKIDQIIIKGGVPDIRFKWHDLSNLDLMTLITWQDHPLRITIESAQAELPLISDDPPPIRFTVNGVPAEWRGGPATCQDIKALAMLEDDACLHLMNRETVNRETGEYELILSDDSFTLVDGMVFTSHVGPEPEAEATEDDGGGFLPLNTFTPTVAAGTKS